MTELKIPHYVQRALKRLETRKLVLTASHSEEAENNGGGVPVFHASRWTEVSDS
jgi:hypothetical protein